MEIPFMATGYAAIGGRSISHSTTLSRQPKPIAVSRLANGQGTSDRHEFIRRHKALERRNSADGAVLLPPRQGQKFWDPLKHERSFALESCRRQFGRKKGEPQSLPYDFRVEIGSHGQVVNRCEASGSEIVELAKTNLFR